MLEIRQNIATREWVIISTERAQRPEEFIQADSAKQHVVPAFASHCPFCPGNEELDLERLRLPVDGDWQVRVVQNRYPALREVGESVHSVEGIHFSISGVGYHEVVIESRLHNSCPALESAEEIERTLSAFILRSLAIRADPRIEQIIYFKNHGPAAGMSLAHPHTQLLALPIVPYSIRSRVEVARRYFDDHGVCVICRMREQEELEQVRIVVESEHFSAFIPYAAFSPFHLWIVPRQHRPSFLDSSPEELHDLSLVLRAVLRKLYFGLNDPDYNYIIRSAPEHEQSPGYLHWYLSIIPRVTRSAGFELGSGMFINTTLPEDSASFLRALTPPPGAGPLCDM
jgi:UDPglucose--hexose-1-phosphate uridylyltransferase